MAKARCSGTVWQGWLPMMHSFLLWIALANLVWEAAQLPLYKIWTERSLAYNVFAVIHCTVGDVLIAVTTVLGAGYTIYSEWVNTGV